MFYYTRKNYYKNDLIVFHLRSTEFRPYRLFLSGFLTVDSFSLVIQSDNSCRTCTVLMCSVIDANRLESTLNFSCLPTSGATKWVTVVPGADSRLVVEEQEES